MYLVLRDDEKIIVETVKDLETSDLTGCIVYSLAQVDAEELVFDGEIRDTIYDILKGEQMPKQDVIEKVQDRLGISMKRIKSVMSKMKKEKVIYMVEDLWDNDGNRWIGIV